MCTVLRGLLQSPALTTSAGCVRLQSAETLHLRPQHYVTYGGSIDQSDCSNKSPINDQQNGFVEQIFENRPSHIDVKMECNISEEMFCENNKFKNYPVNNEGCYHDNSVEVQDRIKKEDARESGTVDIRGVYYRYTTEDTIGQECWDIQGRKSRQDKTYDSPFQVYSPQLDKSQRKEKTNRKQKIMNVRSDALLATPPPQAYSPTGVPDFSQEGYIASSFGSGYGYDGSFSYFEESLLSPPESLDFSKLGDCPGELSLSECGGVFDSCPGIDMDPDWLNEPIPLHTPDEQEGDVTLFTHTSQLTNYTTFTDTIPISPESSYPPTPVVGSPTSDVDQVLSLFDDQSNNLQTYMPNDYLSFGQEIASSTDTTPYDTPYISPVQSPYGSTPDLSPVPSYLAQDQSPDPSFSSDASSLSVKDLLVNERSSSSLQTRKRKQPASGESSTPKPKRRLSKAAKKERKKEQNKTAALRYRQKKKEEKNGSFSNLDVLEAKNAQLKQTVNSITAEIKYLKKLWSEVSAVKQLKQQELCLPLC